VGRHRLAVDDAESIAAALDELRDGGDNRLDLLDVG
jgi:hypothetical protein